MKNKKKKKKEIDDVSYTDMNVDGFSWYEDKNTKKKKKELNNLQITKRERRAIILAGIQSYLPFFLIFLVSFCLAFLLLYLWL
ncbi:MAG: hypothetical protein WCS56_00945 [Bacilli bacterium]